MEAVYMDFIAIDNGYKGSTEGKAKGNVRVTFWHASAMNLGTFGEKSTRGACVG